MAINEKNKNLVTFDELNLSEAVFILKSPFKFKIFITLLLSVPLALFGILYLDSGFKSGILIFLLPFFFLFLYFFALVIQGLLGRNILIVASQAGVFIPGGLFQWRFLPWGIIEDISTLDKNPVVSSLQAVALFKTYGASNQITFSTKREREFAGIQYQEKYAVLVGASVSFRMVHQVVERLKELHQGFTDKIVTGMNGAQIPENPAESVPVSE